VATAHNLEPTVGDIPLNRGIVLAKLGKADEALESWQRAASISPDDHRPLVNIGVGLRKLDPPESEGALEAFLKAAALQPNESKLVFAMGETYEELERYEEAMYQFALAGRLEPKRYKDMDEKNTKLQWKAVEKQNNAER
jgi:tetratricopeptide (TPR) repeat protein